MSASLNRKILLLMSLWVAFAIARAEASVESRRSIIAQSEIVAILSLVAISEATDIRESFARKSDSRAICLKLLAINQDQSHLVVDSVKQVVSDVIEGPDCGQPCMEDWDPWEFKCAHLTVGELKKSRENIVKVRVITGFHILEGAVKIITLRKAAGRWRIISSRIDVVA